MRPAAPHSRRGVEAVGSPNTESRTALEPNDPLLTSAARAAAAWLLARARCTDSCASAGRGETEPGAGAAVARENVAWEEEECEWLARLGVADGLPPLPNPPSPQRTIEGARADWEAATTSPGPSAALPTADCTVVGRSPAARGEGGSCLRNREAPNWAVVPPAALSSRRRTWNPGVVATATVALGSSPRWRSGDLGAEPYPSMHCVVTEPAPSAASKARPPTSSTPAATSTLSEAPPAPAAPVVVGVLLAPHALAEAGSSTSMGTAVDS